MLVSSYQKWNLLERIGTRYFILFLFVIISLVSDMKNNFWLLTFRFLLEKTCLVV